MSKSIITKAAVFLSALAPVSVLAQTYSGTGLESLFHGFQTGVNSLIPYVLVIIAIYLIVVAIQFVFAGGDAEKRATAQSKIVWGLVGVVLIFAMYWLVYAAASLFTFNNVVLPPAPTING